jgi:RNA polymerase sigma-70 factor (ECF subfamily)
MSAIPNFSPSRFLTPATDESKLIILSQQGDAEAFARLYTCYVERITRYVYFRVTDHELAEDITSRIFLKMLEKLDMYQIGQSPIVAWLYRMAHNAVIDHYRMKKTFLSLEDLRQSEVRQEDGIEEKLELQIKSQQLRAALQVLTEEQQSVLILKFIDGLSTREIAQRLGKRQGAVRGLQMRASKIGQVSQPEETATFVVSELIFISIQSLMCYFCVAFVACTRAGKPAQRRRIPYPSSHIGATIARRRGKKGIQCHISTANQPVRWATHSKQKENKHERQ